LRKPVGYHREEAVSKGRMEIRETYLYIRESNLADGWDSVKTIACVLRNFLSKTKEHKTKSFYITDLQTADAENIATGIRSHWYIENKLHYTKDVIMQEDALCTKNRQAAANLALFRDFAFNILKTENKSIKQATEIFANWNVNELLDIMLRT
jgi:predicted transposase YbfD/YdcC